MREKLKELSEILKTNPAIKERLERLEFGCITQEKWSYFNKIIYVDTENITLIRIWKDYIHSYLRSEIIFDGSRNKIIGCEPQYSDIFEYLGQWYWMDCFALYWPIIEKTVILSPWALFDQSDYILDEIIFLCKNVIIDTYLNYMVCGV